MPVGTAGDDIAVVPGHLQYFGGGARGRGVGIGAQVADAGMHLQTTIWQHSDNAIHAAAAGIMIALADAKTRHLAAIGLT